MLIIGTGSAYLVLPCRLWWCRGCIIRRSMTHGYGKSVLSGHTEREDRTDLKSRTFVTAGLRSTEIGRLKDLRPTEIKPTRNAASAQTVRM